MVKPMAGLGFWVLAVLVLPSRAGSSVAERVLSQAQGRGFDSLPARISKFISKC